MEFLIIVLVITAGLCWFASIEWAYHYGRAKQAEEIRFRMRRHGIVFKRDETSLADRKMERRKR